MQIPAQFEYERATSVDHAIALLTQYGEEARLLAGGHSLLPMMKLRLARPECLVDINDLADLDYIREEAGVLKVGAMVRHRALLSSPVVARRFPIIADAERVIADPVVRNRGTLGGSLCQADPAEDLSTVCDALSATVVVRGPGGERTLSMGEFHRGAYETALSPDEILTEVRLPIRPGAGSAYTKVERRVGDWAVAAAAAAVWLRNGVIDDVGIGLTAVGLSGRTVTAAEEAVRGSVPSEAAFAEAGRAAAAACNPVADQRGSAAYKRHLAGELTIRSLRSACDRAMSSEG